MLLRSFFLLLFVAFLIDAQTPDAASRGILMVRTIPAGVTVAIDGDSIGITPFNGPVTAEHHAIALSLTGFRTVNDTILVRFDSVTTYSMKMRAVPGLSLYTLPSNARVTVDGYSAGTTPLIGYTVPRGMHTVVLELDEHRRKEFTVRVDSGDGESRTVPLTPVFGFLSVSTVQPGAEILVDSFSTAQTVAAMKLAVGPHHIRINHPDFPFDVEGTAIVSPAQHIIVKNDLTARSYRAVFGSAILPGFGQIFDGSVWKGSAEFTLTALSALAMKNAIRNVTSSRHDLSVQQESYNIARNEPDAVQRRDMLLHTQSAVKTALRMRTVFIASTALCYIGTLTDAWLHHSVMHWIDIREVRPVPVLDRGYDISWTTATVRIPL